MQTIILCGGLATRLGEMAKTIPKILINIAGRTAGRRVITIREKQLVCSAGYINGGLYLFDGTIAKMFPRDRDNFSVERDVFPKVSNLYALQTDADWIDIGVPERLTYARQHFRNGVFR